MNREWTEIWETTCADKPLLSDGLCLASFLHSDANYG